MEKIALVTGASRGIGRAIATELAHRGWAVCIGYRVRQDKAEKLAAELAGEGCRVMTCQADVSRREEVERMVRRVEQTLGPVSLLVNNAGIAGQCLFQDLTDERWHEFFSVNVDGAFYASRAVLPHMLHEHEGCIVNISSIWGQRLDPLAGCGAGAQPHPGELRGAGGHPDGYAERAAAVTAAAVGGADTHGTPGHAGGYCGGGGISGLIRGRFHHRTGADLRRGIYSLKKIYGDVAFHWATSPCFRL